MQILQQFDVECEIDFDVKSIESIEDFGRLSDVYSDDGTVIIEIRWFGWEETAVKTVLNVKCWLKMKVLL